MTEIARLLTASRAHHADYQREQRKTNGKAALANYRVCEQHVVKALETRTAAHALDPQHEDSSWAEDKVPHVKLVRFYEHYQELP